MPRLTTWILIGWCALCVLWLGSGLMATDCDTSFYAGACRTGQGIAAIFILLVWAVVMVPLSIIWYATKPKVVERRCPVCGRDIPVGYVQCGCGYNFALNAVLRQGPDGRFYPPS